MPIKKEYMSLNENLKKEKVNKKVSTFPDMPLITLKEDRNNYQKLNCLSTFLYGNFFLFVKFHSIILNFSLKDIAFNKKKAVSFFITIEYLTNQKCVATLSSKNVLELKLRKGDLVGCKVTLRKRNLIEFLDNLSITLPRMEKFTNSLFKTPVTNKTNSFGITLLDLILFFPIEISHGVGRLVSELDINFIFSSYDIDEKKFLLESYKIPS